jgi:hypothetical protein
MADQSKIRGLGGGAVLALLIIGVVSVVLAITSHSTGHAEASAISLLASAVAFAAIANVIFRA